jgi:heat shock protein HtpX
MQPRSRGGSFAWRFIAAMSVFLFFTLTILAISGVLFLLPLVVFYLAITSPKGGGHVFAHALIFGACWGTGWALLRGILAARRDQFEPPSAPLSRADAPKLFAVLDDLSRACGTAPPVDIYLSLFPDLGVLEVGGFLGFGTRRVLVLGAPLLASSSVDELRAALAHELGHFAGGDTRLSGMLAFTMNAFRGMLRAANAPGPTEDSHVILAMAAQFSRFLVRNLVRGFAWLYLRATRPSARRQEIAADALAVEVVGRDAAIRMLENAHVVDALYAAYVARDVERAIACEVIPTDVLQGFLRFRTRCRERGLEETVTTAFRKLETDPFDSHPALTERIAKMRALSTVHPDGTADPARDDRPASELLAGTFDLEAWTTRQVREQADRQAHRRWRFMTWDDLAKTTLPEWLHGIAREQQRRIGGEVGRAQTAASRLGALVRAYEAGHAPIIASLVAPHLAQLPPDTRDVATTEISSSLAAIFFQTALLERGSEIVAFVGEPHDVHRFEGETVTPAEIVDRAMRHDDARRLLRTWADRLADPPAAATDAATAVA